MVQQHMIQVESKTKSENKTQKPAMKGQNKGMTQYFDLFQCA